MGQDGQENTGNKKTFHGCELYSGHAGVAVTEARLFKGCPKTECLFRGVGLAAQPRSNRAFPRPPPKAKPLPGS